MNPPRASRAGLTLIEVLIASSILVAVVAMAFGILYSSTSIADKTSNSACLEARGRELLSFCRRQFYTGRFRDPQNLQTLGLYDGNTQIRYQIPVNRDDSGAMQYGYTGLIGINDPQPNASKACVLRFEANTLLKEGPGSPNAVQIPASLTPPLPALPALATVVINADANTNGSFADSFVQGKIMKYVLVPDATQAGGQRIESTETLDDQVVLGVDPATGQFQGTIAHATGPGSANPPDADGVYRGDWLFRYVDAGGNAVLGPFPGTQAIGVLVTVWHGNYLEIGKGYILRRDRETVRFRNSQ